jgi:hypothetical protein
VILNGTPFPHASDLDGTGAMGGGSGSIQEAFEMGFNFGEIWPEGTEEAQQRLALHRLVRSRRPCRHADFGHDTAHGLDGRQHQ